MSKSHHPKILLTNKSNISIFHYPQILLSLHSIVLIFHYLKIQLTWKFKLKQHIFIKIDKKWLQQRTPLTDATPDPPSKSKSGGLPPPLRCGGLGPLIWILRGGLITFYIRSSCLWGRKIHPLLTRGSGEKIHPLCMRGSNPTTHGQRVNSHTPLMSTRGITSDNPSHRS